MKNVLAIDMGATSIRICLGKFNKNGLDVIELLRFGHNRKTIDGRSRWDWDKIIKNIINTIEENIDNIDAIGVDTWGVDFAYLDDKGDLIESPISYRDKMNQIGYADACKKVDPEEIYKNTGNQLMGINTLFQIYQLKKYDVYNRIDKILMLPDYINYLLTGNMFMEESIASTTQLIDMNNIALSYELLNKFDISDSLFADIIKAGNIVGTTSGSKFEKIRKYNIPVIAIASHDTASAVMMTDAFREENTLFLSCGTWSLIGCITDKAIVNTNTYYKSLTNEIGYGSKNMLLKNITGLYLVEKLKEYIQQSRDITFEEIGNYVLRHIDVDQRIDVEYPKFGEDDYDIVKEINKYLHITNQSEPENIMDYFTIIYKSLCYKYKEVISDIEDITGKKFNKLHIIGGGSKSSLFCQMIADICNLYVKSGPVEATVSGNMTVQLITIGEISSIEDGVFIANKTGEGKEYSPRREEI